MGKRRFKMNYEKAILKSGDDERKVYIYRLEFGKNDGEIMAILLDETMRLFTASVWGWNNTSLTVSDWH